VRVPFSPSATEWYRVARGRRTLKSHPISLPLAPLERGALQLSCRREQACRGMRPNLGENCFAIADGVPAIQSQGWIDERFLPLVKEFVWDVLEEVEGY